ncbi:amino acid ABC transporter ATP-binding protein [Haloimpatiens sp. FM7330]|uniref:amino acid ABC transporter ATP-binding protein n=1 Tax=Haloimpatiens sp. FM7330 TaxID=3298610 RepID=UPI0036413070
MNIISIKNLNKKYGTFEALKNIELDIEKGKIISIIGPSGSGKSTLLRSIIKLEKIDNGSIKIEDEFIVKHDDKDKNMNIPKKRIANKLKKMGMVFQNFNLFPNKTVLQNIIEAPIIVNKIEKQEAINIANDLLLKVGLSDKKDSYPSQISGGQKQRVAIARALAMKPEILLFDEPTSALDPELVGEVLEVIKKLAKETNMTMLIVTHEIAFAREVSDKIIFMDKGEVLEYTDPENIFTNPSHPRVKEFLAKML